MRQGRLLLSAALLLALSLAACTSMSFTQRLFIWGTDFTVQRDLVYGDDPRQKLDIYTPTRRPIEATLVFIYGGSWSSGAKDLYRFLGQAFASRGYLVVVPDYRLYPKVRYPAFVEDTARAFAWTKAYVERTGGDTRRLVLMGHSAGAYNAAMVALDPAYLAAFDLKPNDIAAVMSLAGPLSFNPLKTESTKDIFAPAAEAIDTARPVRVAVKGAAAAPPMLVIHGKEDETVNFSNSQHLAEAVNAHGGRAELKFYDKLGHLGVVTCFAWPLRWKAPCLDAVDIFVHAVLANRTQRAPTQ